MSDGKNFQIFVEYSFSGLPMYMERGIRGLYRISTNLLTRYFKEIEDLIQLKVLDRKGAYWEMSMERGLSQRSTKERKK